MADFSFSDDAELKSLNAQVLEDPEEFENWEKLVRATESQEGGLHRNSSPGAIASFREVYDKFLAKFPLFFGYWKKYADIEFAIAGTEAAEMVYERGVASIGISADLWTNYCTFKVDTSHDSDVIRELFERGADSAGLDFLSHPFWDKYLEFEERVEAQDRIFAILDRIIHLPLHQYARYFDKYRTMAAQRPIPQLAPPDVIEQFRQEIVQESGPKQKSERDAEQDLRQKIDNYHMDLFRRTQDETTKRWAFEQEIKRPYFHVTELDDPQLDNWRKYLDFEETEGDYARTKFLYERCLVTAANYEEFWLRYARWMLAREGRQEEVRNIYQRASCLYVPISRPNVRLFYARFEESVGNADIATAIHEAVLMHNANHVETIISLANAHRRQYGLDSAIDLLKKYIENPECSSFTRGALVSEWARIVWKIKGDADTAREIYQANQNLYLDCHPYWTHLLDFEIQQPPTAKEDATQYERVKGVFEVIRRTSQLSPESMKGLSSKYFAFLEERGGKDSMKEFMELDREINGPSSVKFGAEDGDRTMQNGHSGVEVSQPQGRKGRHASSKQQQRQQPVEGHQPSAVR